MYIKGQWQFDLTSKLMPFLRNMQRCPPKGQGTIIDVGANNGVISIGMIYSGELKRAIAIEPEPNNFSLLQNNVKQNGMQKEFICLPFAVSDREGELAFELSNNNLGDHRVKSVVTDRGKFDESDRRVVTVKSYKLDTILENLSEAILQDIAIIWINVQGHEGYVFKGARKTFLRKTPVVSQIFPYGVLRSGMSVEQFCEIARSIWSNYWVLRDESFVSYSIDNLSNFFSEIGFEGKWDNVIFFENSNCEEPS